MDKTLEALQAAPFPLENTKTIDSDDIQRWADRYRIWYNDIRCYILEQHGIEPSDSFYYQIDRLIQISIQIKQESSPEIKKESSPEAKDKPPAIILGTVKKT